jgi:hypothetical protein
MATCAPFGGRNAGFTGSLAKAENEATHIIANSERKINRLCKKLRKISLVIAWPVIEIS